MSRVRVYPAPAAPFPRIEFHQHDWMPGWAAFIDDGLTFNEASTAFCTLNLGSFITAVHTKAMPAADLPYVIAESMMHEVIHVIEKWAGVEFSEERVESLLDRYREVYGKPDGEPVKRAA